MVPRYYQDACGCTARACRLALHTRPAHACDLARSRSAMVGKHRLSGLVASSLLLEKTLVQKRRTVTLVSKGPRDRDDAEHRRSVDVLAAKFRPICATKVAGPPAPIATGRPSL